MKRKPRSTKIRTADPPRGGDSLQRVWESACEAHRSGDLATARAGYQQVLLQQPRHADARHLLGFAAFQGGDFQAAIVQLATAVELRPDSGEFHNNLALALAANGQFDQASQHASRAKQLGHDDGHGFLHVGWELARCQRWEHAERVYRLALIVQPDTAEPYNYLGALFAARKQWPEAVQCYRDALRWCPDYIEAWNNLGNAYREQDQLPDAITCYQQAIELDPRFAIAHNNLGLAFARQGNPEAATEAYRQALRWEPEFAEAWNNLGNASCELGRPEDATRQYRQALTLNPSSAEILCNLGTCLRQLQQVDESLRFLSQANELCPNSTPIVEQLGMTLTQAGQFVEAMECWKSLQLREPEQPLWKLREVTTFPTVFPDAAAMRSFTRQLSDCLEDPRWRDWNWNPMDWLNHIPACPFGLQFFEENPRAIKERFATLFQSKLPRDLAGRWIEGWRGPQSRPRIGIVVTDRHEGIFLRSLGGVLLRWSLGWELVVFCSPRARDRLQLELPRPDIHIVPLTPRLDLMAQRVADCQCDLLYYWEVGTDAANYFLPFLRLAPVQVTSWGVQVTSGISTLDAYLSSVQVEPREAAEHYSERLVLANTLLTYRVRSSPPKSADRARFPVPNDHHWYVCAQQPGKFHVDFDAILGEILRRDPRGILIATGDSRSSLDKALKARWDRQLPDVADRMFVLPRLENEAYQSLLHLGDVLLDPLHFGGVNSTYDALSLNKPLVTLPSGFHRGRYTWGCYQKMNFFECVAADVDSYVDLAVRLGTDASYRHDVQRRLAEASPVLFNDPFSIAEHERLFSELLGIG